MELEPPSERITGNGKDEMWFGPPHEAAEANPPDLMVYFLPGNPCLMLYYEPFLSRLSTLLNFGNSDQRRRVVVGGCSLPGFQLSQPLAVKGPLPASLEDEILSAEELVQRAIDGLSAGQGDRRISKHTKVVLMAHSAGTYMTLELLRRRAQRLNDLHAIDIIGAVLLFPTVTELGKSRNGRVFNTFLYIPYFPAIVAAIVRVFTFLISVQTLAGVLSRVGRVPQHVGQAAAEFLKSPMGVQQALYLTTDEMKSIKRDLWDETIWGSSQPTMEAQDQVVPLRFYFGEHDVWVSNRARDELIASRARRPSESRISNRPVMVIDKEKIPHEFTNDHSERIAEKAMAMVNDLAEINSNGKNDKRPPAKDCETRD